MKFNKTQKKALWKSAWHWLENYENAVASEIGKIEMWDTSCPCCEKWIDQSSGLISHCYGCPISEYSGDVMCRSTPWIEAEFEYSRYDDLEDNCNLVEACRQEYEFLVTLALEEEYEL